MSPELTQNLPLIVGGAIILLIAIFVIMRMNRRARVIRDENAARDVLDEGAARAQRNQALIDAQAATVAPPAATPPPEVEPTPAPDPAPPLSSGDDLTRIKGLGPKIATMLNEQGITRFAQIAAWSESDVERVDATLGRFAGRITRDQWVEQAKLLESGDESGFSAKFGQTQ